MKVKLVPKQELPQEVAEGQREVFVSYHFTTLDASYNGFGNIVGAFNPEVYQNRLGKFVEDMEKWINMTLEDQLKLKVQVKVLFFR